MSRVFDDDIKASAIELVGRNISTTSLTLPCESGKSLAIKKPVMTLHIKNLDMPFSINMELQDASGCRRRVRLATHLKQARVAEGTCSVPLTLGPGWSEVVIDLRDICYAAYKVPFMELRGVTIHANCRIRLIAVSDDETKSLPASLSLPRRVSGQETPSILGSSDSATHVSRSTA